MAGEVEILRETLDKAMQQQEDGLPAIAAALTNFSEVAPDDLKQVNFAQAFAELEKARHAIEERSNDDSDVSHTALNAARIALAKAKCALTDEKIEAARATVINKRGDDISSDPLRSKLDTLLETTLTTFKNLVPTATQLEASSERVQTALEKEPNNITDELLDPLLHIDETFKAWRGYLIPYVTLKVNEADAEDNKAEWSKLKSLLENTTSLTIEVIEALQKIQSVDNELLNYSLFLQKGQAETQVIEQEAERVAEQAQEQAREQAQEQAQEQAREQAQARRARQAQREKRGVVHSLHRKPGEPSIGFIGHLHPEEFAQDTLPNLLGSYIIAKFQPITKETVVQGFNTPVATINEPQKKALVSQIKNVTSYKYVLPPVAEEEGSTAEADVAVAPSAGRTEEQRTITHHVSGAKANRMDLGALPVSNEAQQKASFTTLRQAMILADNMRGYSSMNLDRLPSVLNINLLGNAGAAASHLVSLKQVAYVLAQEIGIQMTIYPSSRQAYQLDDEKYDAIAERLQELQVASPIGAISLIATP